MDWLIPGLGGGAVFMAMLGFRLSRSRPWAALEAQVSPAGAMGHVRSGKLLVRLGRLRVATKLGREDETRRRLQLAGQATALDLFRGIQVATGCTCLIPFVLTGVSFPPALALAPVACLAGIRIPEIVLARRAGRRQERIAASVPDLVELLLTTTEAGLSPPVALRRTTEVLRGPLGDEVRVAVNEVELGVPWQRAIHGLVDRTNVPALRALEIALGRSQKLGGSLSTTLRRVVDDLRAARRGTCRRDRP
jgi:Flp pilus assembly protein TadB